jgi:hypothetical protein
MSFISSGTAQMQEPWKTYTSEDCNVSFQYPSNWLIKTKQGTFDTNTTYLVAVYNPTMNLTSPAFGLANCVDIDVVNSMMKVFKSNPLIGDKFPFPSDNASDAKSLSLIAEASEMYVSSLFGSFLQLPEVVEHTTVRPKLIGGEDTAFFTILNKSDANSTNPDIGSRQYFVLHNGLSYPFVFTDIASKFDNPENMKIRERIINSIRFTN